MAPYRFQVNPTRADVARGNTLLKGRGRTYFDPGYRTTLSIKSVRAGEARYVTPKSVYRVTPDTFAILNRGQQYSLEIRPQPRTVSSRCVTPRDSWTLRMTAPQVEPAESPNVAGHVTIPAEAGGPKKQRRDGVFWGAECRDRTRFLV